MKIGLDFDGVISDCGKLKSYAAMKLYGKEIPPEKFKKEIVVGEGYLTAEQYRELQKIIYGTRGMGLLMEPVNGIKEYLPKIIGDGHSVIVVTSRGDTELEIAKEWSWRQGFALNFIGVGYGKSKAEAARGLDFYIDDDLDKLEPLVGIVPNLYLFSWGYNEGIDVGSIAKRIASWRELYETVRALS